MVFNVSYSQLYVGKVNVSELDSLRYLLIEFESASPSGYVNQYNVDLGPYNYLKKKVDYFTDSTGKNEVDLKGNMSAIINYISNSGWDFVQMTVNDYALSSGNNSYYHILLFKRKR